MKKLLLFLLTSLLIIAGCSKGETEVNQEATNTEVSQEVDNSTGELNSENVNDENEIESEMEQEQLQGFSSFTEISDFVIEEKTFESLHTEVNEDAIGATKHAIKAEDGTIYYFVHVDTDGTPNYLVYSFDENNQAVVEDIIYSPTKKKLLEEDENFYLDSKILANTLVLKYEYYEDYSEFTKQVTVESLDISHIFDGQKNEYETEVVFDQQFNFIEDEIDDFGEIVSTTAGPVFVYKENPLEDRDFQVLPLNNTELAEELVLYDPHDIVDESDDIKFINFEQGHYFVHDYFDDGIKRLEIETGEPLYDDAYDKVLLFERSAIDEVYPLNDTLFYIINDSDHMIYVVHTELEMVDSISFFDSEYEMDDYDGYIDGPFYLGNNEFLIIDEYEYQRQDRMRFYVTEYGF